MPLSDILHNKITILSEIGNDLFDEDKFEEAQKQYQSAFDLVPIPKNDYEASSWLLAGIGDCLYYQQSYEKALGNFKYGEACLGGLNAFMWLRIGECYAELRNTEMAREYLLRAYMMEGEAFFTEDDAKYFSVITDLVEKDIFKK